MYYVCVCMCVYIETGRENANKNQSSHLFCTFLRTYGKNIFKLYHKLDHKISLSKFQRYRILAMQALFLIANAIKLEFNNKDRTQRTSDTRYTKEYGAKSHMFWRRSKGEMKAFLGHSGVYTCLWYWEFSMSPWHYDWHCAAGASMPRQGQGWSHWDGF